VDRRPAKRTRLHRQGGAAGQRPAKTFAGLILRDKGGVLRAHQKVITAAGDGEITSGTFSPSLSQSIAFARLPGRRARHRRAGGDSRPQTDRDCG
jgi:glycine cleavage system aminomethyltransferase T